MNITKPVIKGENKNRDKTFTNSFRRFIDERVLYEYRRYGTEHLLDRPTYSSEQRLHNAIAQEIAKDLIDFIELDKLKKKFYNILKEKKEPVAETRKRLQINTFLKLVYLLQLINENTADIACANILYALRSKVKKHNKLEKEMQKEYLYLASATKEIVEKGFEEGINAPNLNEDLVRLIHSDLDLNGLIALLALLAGKLTRLIYEQNSKIADNNALSNYTISDAKTYISTTYKKWVEAQNIIPDNNHGC